MREKRTLVLFDHLALSRQLALHGRRKLRDEEDLVQLVQDARARVVDLSNAVWRDGEHGRARLSCQGHAPMWRHRRRLTRLPRHAAVGAAVRVELMAREESVHGLFVPRRLALVPLSPIALHAHLSAQLVLCLAHPLKLRHEQWRDHLRYLVDVRPLLGLDAQQPRDDPRHQLRVAVVQWSVGAFDDRPCDDERIATLKGRTQHGGLIEDATERPYVGLLAVRFGLDDFRALVQHRPHHGLHDRPGTRALLCQPKVGQLDVALGSDHDVGRREVAVHHMLLLVDVPQREAHLGEKLPDARLGHALALFREAVQMVQESGSLDELHHDVKGVALLE
mmetsp:Transcript_61556/g.148250  ORF Transcript_61556/g.148250 Transcript_61556/m.148250 type:complete len:335 (+) Transcript_61556:523-1527(+)